MFQPLFDQPAFQAQRSYFGFVPIDGRKMTFDFLPFVHCLHHTLSHMIKLKAKKRKKIPEDEKTFGVQNEAIQSRRRIDSD